jgi:FKBP-type peptidyl-prolyl cis-trans isomerase FkpA
MRNLLWSCLLVASCCFGACSKKKCGYTDDGAVASTAEQQAVKHYLDSVGITAVLHPRGFYYKIDTTGTGVAPGECSQITVAYMGLLTNGSTFDQQNSFVAELANLIDGWQQGVPLIKQGGSIRLFIPPSLGYGGQAQKDATTGNIVIPAYSILIFDIHLLDVQ